MDETDLGTLNETLLANAQKPQSANIDGNSVSQHPIPNQIAMAHHVAGQVASSRGHFGLRFTQLVPPGCG